MIYNNATKAVDIINDIRNYFINFIRVKSKNVELHEIGIDIVTVLVNLPEFYKLPKTVSFNLKQVKYLKRIINYIMAKLNSWGLVYCPYPKFPFLLFSYANLNNYKEKKMKELYDKKDKYTFLDNPSIDPHNYECFKYTHLYDTFVKNKEQSKTLKKYKNIIRLRWKGKELDIQNVYADFSYLIFNSHYLYMFYDIYFMYHIAAFFYEMQKICQTFLSQEIKMNNWYVTIHSEVLPTGTKPKKHTKLNQRNMDYPLYLNSLVNKIMHLEKNMYTGSKMNIKDIFEELKEIKNVFTNSNIIFINELPKEKKIKAEDLNNYRSLTDEIIEAMSMLFNKCYSKIKNNDRSVKFSIIVEEIENDTENIESN